MSNLVKFHKNCSILRQVQTAFCYIETTTFWFLNLKCLSSKIWGLKRNETSNDDGQNNVNEVRKKANYQALDLKISNLFLLGDVKTQAVRMIGLLFNSNLLSVDDLI